MFSFLQKGRQELDISFIPNIMISPQNFRVIMYDAETDLLICSHLLDIFTNDKGSKVLKNSSIIVLWMVLHYEMFLKRENSPFKNDDKGIKKLKANFEERVAEKKYVYDNQLEFKVRSFSKCEATKEQFPNFESLLMGEDVMNIVQNLEELRTSSHSDDVYESDPSSSDTTS